MGIFFLILKIILFILLIIISLLLFIVAILVFCPLRYDVLSEKKSSLYVNAKISWLFGIVRFRYSLDGEKSGMRLSALGIRIKGANKKDKKSKLKKNKKNSLDIDEEIENNIKESHPEDKTDIPKKENIKYKNINIDQEKLKEKKPKDKIKRKKDKEKTTVIEKIIGGIKKISESKEKVSYIANYPEKKIIIKHTITCLKELWHALKPKKLNLNIELGFDNPASTGYALGAIYSLKPLFKNNIIVIGNFEEQIVKYKGEIKGSLSVWSLLFPLVKYSLKRPIFKIILKLLRKDKREDENIEHKSKLKS